MKLEAMVVGAQKAGTTALLEHLSGCAGISAQESFEFPYFANNSFYEQGFDAALARWFGDTSGMLVAKSVGVMFLPWARERLFEHNPECRLIVCLRDPVSRAHSAYWYLRKTGQETLGTFEAALDAEAERMVNAYDNHHFAYVDRGRYYPQLIELESLFGRSRLCLVSSADLRSQPRVELARVLRFLDVDETTASDLDESLRVNSSVAARSTTLARMLHKPATTGVGRWASRALRAFPGARGRVVHLARKLNERGDFTSPELRPETRERLSREFATSNALLEEHFGFDTSAWS